MAARDRHDTIVPIGMFHRAGKTVPLQPHGTRQVFFVIVAARAAGVTHIVEEGREGGLTAYLYRKHGFRVTSIEYLPLDSVGQVKPLRQSASALRAQRPSPFAQALRQMAPDIVQLNGDGRTIIPSLLGSLSPTEAARIAVIFDGEKRLAAYETFKQIRHRIALAVFDDSNQGADSKKFMATVRGAEIMWPPRFAKLYHELWAQQKQVYGLEDWQRYKRIHAMLPEERGRHPEDFVYFHSFQHFHWAEFIFVKGDAWT